MSFGRGAAQSCHGSGNFLLGCFSLFLQLVQFMPTNEKGTDPHQRNPNHRINAVLQHHCLGFGSGGRFGRRNKSGNFVPGLLVQDLAEEQFRALVLRVVEKRYRFILLDDLTLIHEDHAVCDLTGKAHLVRDANHRHAFFG